VSSSCSIKINWQLIFEHLHNCDDNLSISNSIIISALTPQNGQVTGDPSPGIFQSLQTSFLKEEMVCFKTQISFVLFQKQKSGIFTCLCPQAGWFAVIRGARKSKNDEASPKAVS